MRFLLGTLILAAVLSNQTRNAPPDPVRTAVGRLDLAAFKTHIEWLTQFGDRMQGTERNRSARFIFWNNKDFGMDGSGTYALERAPLQGTAAEPKWLGVIQHDMMMFDHGMPPGPKQTRDADIDIEYQKESRMAVDSAKLAATLRAANRTHARDYPATIGTDMAGTDSIRFEDLVASVSVRENERVIEIVRGSNPNHHQPTDKYESYAEEDFRFGFNSAQTTLGALGQLAVITLLQRR